MDKNSLKKLEKLLVKLMPLVGSATKKLRFLMLMGIAVILWLFVFMFVLQDLNDLPEMIDEIKADLTSSLQSLTNTKKATAVNAVSGAKDLWEIRSLLSNGREMLGDYVSIAVLANPLSLFLGVLSVLSLFFLVLLGIILGLFAIF